MYSQPSYSRVYHSRSLWRCHCWDLSLASPSLSAVCERECVTCVRIHTCLHTCIYTCMLMHACTCMHVRTYISRPRYRRHPVHVHWHQYMWINMCTCAHSYIYIIYLGSHSSTKTQQSDSHLSAVVTCIKLTRRGPPPQSLRRRHGWVIRAPRDASVYGFILATDDRQPRVDLRSALSRLTSFADPRCLRETGPSVSSEFDVLVRRAIVTQTS